MSGEVPSGWSCETLGSAATWLSGGTPSKSNPTYWSGDIPWVSPKDMKQFHTYDAQDHLSRAGVAAGSRMAPPDSVLVVVRGMILAHSFPVCLATRSVAFNQDVKAVVPGDKLTGLYLGNWFIANSTSLLGLVTESTHGTKRIALEDILHVPVHLPPLPEQRRIAEILDTLDEAIRKTEQVIAKLQQMKQGLLHDLLTRGIDENGELRDPVRHPEQFKDSPLGRIPKEWEVRSVRDTGEVKLGRQRAPQHDHGAHMRPYLRVANVFDGHIRFDNVLSMNFSPSEQQAYSLVPGDILLNEGQSLELVGRCAIFDAAPNVYCFQNTLVRFRAYQLVITPSFARAVFKDWLARGVFMQIAKQTTSIAHLGAERFAVLKMACPEVREQHRITTRVRAFEGHVARELENQSKLRLLRQGLMDDLLTGRVRVKVTEAAE